MPYSRTYVVQSLSHVQLFVTPWNATHQASLSFTISWNFHKLMSIEQLSHVLSFLLVLPSVFLSIKVFSPKVSCSRQVARGLELQLQHQFFQWIFRTDFLYDGLVGYPCSPRDSQESSPIPQFKSIHSSVLSFLYSLTLTSIHYYWKNQSFG